MLISVAIANLVISLLCFYGVWQVCRFRRRLIRVTVILDQAERATVAALHAAPEAIASKQVKIAQIRQLLRQLDPTLRQAKQLLLLFGVLQTVMGRRQPQRHSNRFLKSVLPRLR